MTHVQSVVSPAYIFDDFRKNRKMTEIINICELADNLGISPLVLSRKFEEVFGTSSYQGRFFIGTFTTETIQKCYNQLEKLKQ